MLKSRLISARAAGRAQFRFLEPLLLVHGRWSYPRIARMVAFFFYKNLLFGLTIFFYNILCFFSGQILFDGARPLACSMQRSFHSTHIILAAVPGVRRFAAWIGECMRMSGIS